MKIKILSLSFLLLGCSVTLPTPVLFTLQSLTGTVNNRGILVTPDVVQNPLNFGTNLVSLIPFTLQPVNGQVTTNLLPWGYTIRVDGWPRSAHIVVPNSSALLNAVSLINTNAFAPLNIFPAQPYTNGTPVFVLTTFQTGSGETNGVWKYMSLSATNGWTAASWSPFYVATNKANGTNINVRDPAHFRYTDNSGKTTYLLTYTTHFGDWLQSATPGIGIASSPDDTHYTHLGFVNVTNAAVTNSFAEWSPKFFTDATNGLWLTVSLGQQTMWAQPTNVFIAHMSELNFTNFSAVVALTGLSTNIFNLGGIWITNITSTILGSGQMLYIAPMYYYFSKGGIYTNSALIATNWSQSLGSGQALNAALFDGSSVVYASGTYTWYFTDQLLQAVQSTDLVNWTPNIFSTNYSPAVIVPSFQEGTVVIESGTVNPAAVFNVQ